MATRSPPLPQRAAKTARPAPQRLSSVAAAIRLLKSFSDGEEEIGVTRLAERLGVAKSTAHRLASTLVAEGMLERNAGTEKYRLGVGLFGLGALVRQRMNVSSEARPHLFGLRDATGETVHLAILDHADILYVYDLESPQAIRMRANLGERKPALCTAEGRALLAFQPSDEVERVLAQGLSPRTPRTIVDEGALRAMLAEVRRLGFAREDEQSELGMRSIAAPIRDDSGRAVAAVGMAGPLHRLSNDVLAKFAPLVAETAHVISQRLGYKPQAPSPHLKANERRP